MVFGFQEIFSVLKVEIKVLLYFRKSKLTMSNVKVTELKLFMVGKIS